MELVFLIITAYLLGSVPFAQIIAKAHGKDLRKIGSGNIGATNLARALGKKWAYFCFCLDVLKGLIPTFTAGIFINKPVNPKELLLWLAVACAAVVGHVFPLYLKFKGGKGVATSLGVAIGIWPYYTICAAFSLAIWVVVVLISKYASLASITAAISFPIVLICIIAVSKTWDLNNLWPLLIVAIAIPAMVTLLHKKNIKRIAEGTESKIFTK